MPSATIRRAGPASFEGGEGSRHSVLERQHSLEEAVPIKQDRGEAKLAALTDLAHLLLNQNQFYYNRGAELSNEYH